MHPVEIREKTRILRSKGLTHREISRKLHISCGSACLWTRGVSITPKQRLAILDRARKSAFTQQRRKKLRQWAKVGLSQYREHYTNKNLLEKIINFYKENGRIPLKREFNMYREYKRRFGSWNKAICLAGFLPNPELFTHKFKAQDGHLCDSFSEKIIDDWLHDNKIYHKRSVPYPGTRMTADFSLAPNLFLEFFGLAGVQKEYDRLLNKKRKICRSLGIYLIEVYPKHLFPKNTLSNLVTKDLLKTRQRSIKNLV